MAVNESLLSSMEQQKPWVETPLRESYALSQAAGWYGHVPFDSIHTPLPLYPGSHP